MFLVAWGAQHCVPQAPKYANGSTLSRGIEDVLFTVLNEQGIHDLHFCNISLCLDQQEK